MIELLAILVASLMPVDTRIPPGPAYRAQCVAAARDAAERTGRAGYSERTQDEMFATAAFLCGTSGAQEDGSKP